VRVIPE
jgi:hypothetical protein